MSDYLTIDELKYTLEASGQQFFDNDAQAAITAASRGIDEYTSRIFYSSSGTRYYTPEDRYCVEVDDIVSLGTFGLDWNRDGTYSTVWTQGTHYNLAPYNNPTLGKPYESVELIKYSGAFFPPWQLGYGKSVRLIGTFGWSSTPAPVKQACTILATKLMRRAREAPFGVVGIGYDQTAVRISKAADPDICFLLDPFVKDRGALAA